MNAVVIQLMYAAGSLPGVEAVCVRGSVCQIAQQAGRPAARGFRRRRRGVTVTSKSVFCSAEALGYVTYIIRGRPRPAVCQQISVNGAVCYEFLQPRDGYMLHVITGSSCSSDLLQFSAYGFVDVFVLQVGVILVLHASTGTRFGLFNMGNSTGITEDVISNEFATTQPR